MAGKSKVTEGLSREQAAAVESAAAWLSSSGGRNFFTLGGLAGCGKTFIIPRIREAAGLDDDEGVLFGAYTGKAANVMRRRGVPATTLHRMIYVPVEDGKGKVTFVKRETLPETVRLIVVDEASMVSREIHDDLASFGRPILYVGDFGQLPPPSRGDGPPFNLMEESALDAKLTKIHRQAEGNPIITAAMMVRKGRELPIGALGRTVAHMYPGQLSDSSLANADQVICGKNATREWLNQRVRGLTGLSGPPTEGDRIICLRNNRELGVVNGQQFRLVSDPVVTDSLTMEAGVVDEHDWEEYVGRTERLSAIRDGEVPTSEFVGVSGVDAGALESHLRVSTRNFFDVRLEPMYGEFRDRVEADYGYVITCHKAQGSEWPRVLVWDDGFGLGRPEERARWLYTAITRASEALIVVRDFRSRRR